MKKLQSIIKNPRNKLTIWRDNKAYRYIRYSGALRLVPAVNKDEKHWKRKLVKGSYQIEI